MRRTFFWFVLVLAASSQAQVFRFGWRDEIITSRSAESVNASAVDSAGNLVVAGTIQLAANQVDVIVRKYDPLGVKLWEQRIDIGGAKLVDSVQGLVVNAKGEVFISAGTPKNGFDNFVLLKLAPGDGKVVFQQVLDTGTNRASASGIALDQSSDSIVQVGGFGRNAREAFLVVKWSESGDVVWKKTWTNDVKGDRSARSVAVAPNGDIVSVGYSATEKLGQDSTVLKLSASGDVKWAVTYPGGQFPANDSAKCASFDQMGNVLVGGDEYVSGSRNSAYLAKLNGENGTVIWKSDIMEPRGMDGVTVDIHSIGDATLAAVQMNPTSAGGFDMSVLKFDSNGKEVWRSVVDAGPGSNEELAKMVVDKYGFAYISSGSVGPDRVPKFLVACVDPGGKVAWQFRDSSPFNGLPSGVCVDNDSGHIFVSGSKSRGVDDDLGIMTMFQAPRAANDRYTVFEGESLTIGPSSGILSNDVFWRFATLKVTAPLKSGALDLSNDGSFTFLAPKTAGEVTFSYELSREGLTTSGATVTISVIKKPKKDGRLRN